jgi:hypothetical protein
MKAGRRSQKGISSGEGLGKGSIFRLKGRDGSEYLEGLLCALHLSQAS